jgi:LysM repeat protein
MKRLWIAAILVAGMLLVGAHAVSAGQSHPAPVLKYEVHAGDTLWNAAASLAPGKDRRDAVLQLMEFNHLSSPQIFPGQTLRLPSR